MPNIIDKDVSIWWVTKILIALFLIAYAIWSSLKSPFFPVLFTLPIWIGEIFIFLGDGLNTYHYILIKRHNPNISLQGDLITDQGLFKWIRHPMYLGDMLLSLGFTLLIRDVLSICLFFISIPCVIFQSMREDKLLAEKFIEKHKAWREKSWLLLPRIL